LRGDHGRACGADHRRRPPPRCRCRHRHRRGVRTLGCPHAEGRQGRAAVLHAVQPGGEHVLRQLPARHRVPPATDHHRIAGVRPPSAADRLPLRAPAGGRPIRGPRTPARRGKRGRMSNQCTPDIDALARELGFSCQDSPPALRLSNPFGLTNWTLPVIELLIVAGAVLALWWAVRRPRRDGDPVNLVLWCATVLYLLIGEPPLYFPAAFGVDELIGAVFAHNIFTVQFLYDRLPLYIVALYPAMAMVAYEIVRSLGIFRDRGIVVGAICVGFVHQCFYEVFDQLGPQLQWWTWNRGNVINEPMLASVPMASVLLFATVGPAVLTALVLLLV